MDNNERLGRRAFLGASLAGLLGLGSGCVYIFPPKKPKKKRNRENGPNTPENPTEVPTDPTGTTGPHNIEGIVTDIAGRPIDGQEVAYVPNDSSERRRSDDTETDGAYLINEIPEISSGRLVVDRNGFARYEEDINFQGRDLSNIIRNLRLIPEVPLIIGTDKPQYQVDQTGQPSYLMFFKHLTANRDGESVTGLADPFQAVESWPRHLEPVNVTISTGDINLDDLIEEGLNRLNSGASMSKLDDQGNLVSVPIYQRVTSGDVGVSIVLGRNQGVSVSYESVMRGSIGANPELGLKAVSPYRFVVLRLSDRVHPAELAREAERGLAWLALGPQANESVDPGHLLHDNTISLSRPYNGPDRLSHDELNVIQAYRSLPPGTDMVTYENR